MSEGDWKETCSIFNLFQTALEIDYATFRRHYTIQLPLWSPWKYVSYQYLYIMHYSMFFGHQRSNMTSNNKSNRFRIVDPTDLSEGFDWEEICSRLIMFQKVWEIDHATMQPVGSIPLFNHQFGPASYQYLYPMQYSMFFHHKIATRTSSNKGIYLHRWRILRRDL